MDDISYLDPETIGGANLYAYCLNNPIMRVDPLGTEWWKFWEWDWGTILDIGITCVYAINALTMGFIVSNLVSTQVFIHSFLVTRNYGISKFIGATVGLLSGTASGALVFGAYNNTVNAIYYNYILDSQSKIIECNDSSIPSYYVNYGYINRWERLDYTKSVMEKTGQPIKYNRNAWRYYSEYNFHMYGWFMLSLFFESDFVSLSDYARRARHADVDAFVEDRDYKVKFLTRFIGILGQ